MACGTLGCPTLCDICRQAAAERATSLRRTRDQANHRLEELKGHIKVWIEHDDHSNRDRILLDCAWVMLCIVLVLLSPLSIVGHLADHSLFALTSWCSIRSRRIVSGMSLRRSVLSLSWASASGLR